MANDILDVQVVLDVINPASPVNLGNLAVYVVADSANSETAIADVKLRTADDVSNLGLTVNAATQAIIDAFFMQDDHGDYLYLYGIDSSVDQSKTKAKISETITDGWEFATIVSPTANDSVELANQVEKYGRKFAVLGMKTKAAAATIAEIQAISASPFYGNDRTIVFVANGASGDNAQYAAVGALIGALGNKTPGSITWKFKTLKGITPSEVNGSVLGTATELGLILYVTKAGNNQTSEGLTTGIKYIDDLHADDWVRSSIESEVQNLLQTTAKLMYGPEGIAQLEAVVTTVLRQATDNGIILTDAETGAGKFTVSAGAREDQDTSDVASRKYNGLSFEYTRAGAIHDVTVHGIIQNV